MPRDPRFPAMEPLGQFRGGVTRGGWGVRTSGVLLARTCRTFDALESWWDNPRTRRALGSALATLFVAALLLIEMRRRGWLDGAAARLVPATHFRAVAIAFTFLLVIEVASLILALARSVADSVGKQFELLALILIREAFLEFGRAAEPVEWAHVANTVLPMLAEMGGALAVFALLDVYYRLQRHQAITAGEQEQASFVCAKKALALGLLAAFVVTGLWTIWHDVTGSPVAPFFATVYTVLILSDVLVVLISLRYTSTFRVVFRNAGFAAATVIARMALSAPPYVNALLGVAAITFAVLLTWTYNSFMAREGPVRAALPAPRGEIQNGRGS